MAESGRTCKPTDRRGKLEAEPFTVKLARDKVLIEFRGRLVKVLTGAAADELRRAVESGDDAAVQMVAARKTGNFKRGNER
ncbi:MAG: hypothetical protein QM831_07260 [Kofleriaceae bacterium]